MLEKIKNNHMYTTIPPMLECEYSIEDYYEEDYGTKYDLIFGNIIQENHEFLEYEKNHFKETLKSEPKYFEE